MMFRILLFITIVLPVFSFAQNERLSEQEVQDQAKFLDALQLRILEQYDEAIEAFVKLEEEDPQNDVVHFELAKLYWVKRLDEEAIDHARKAVEYQPKQRVYKEFLIDVYSKTKDYASLNQALEEFIRSGHFDESYYFQLANSYKKTGLFKDALNLMKELERRVGYKKSIGQTRASIYRRQDNKKKLVKELDRLSENFPDDINVLLQKATLLETVGEKKKAYQVYQDILELNPNHITANRKLAAWNKNAKTEAEFLASLEPLMRNSKFPKDEKIKELIPYVPRLKQGGDSTFEMLKLLDILQKEYPDDAKINALQGDVYFNTGQAEKSKYYYQKTIELDKSVFMVWKNLMLAQDNTGDFNNLKKTAEEAIDFFPNQGVCYYYAGKANIENGRNIEGLEWLQEGLFLVGKNQHLKMEFHLMLAHAYLLQNQPGNAQRQFDKVDGKILGPRHAFFFEIKGDLDFRNGKTKQALQSWKQALLNGGNKERIESKIINAEKL